MLSSIVLFNAATPQARKEDAVEHLQVFDYQNDSDFFILIFYIRAWDVV
jgi:hypothetical protein